MHPSSCSFIASSMAIRSSMIGCHDEASLRPVLAVRGATFGERVERVADLAQRQPDALGHPDEPDAPEHVGAVPAMAGLGALAVDEPVGLVEAQRGGGHPGARRHLADRERSFTGADLTADSA